MKSIRVLFLALVLFACLVLTGCGDKSSEHQPEVTNAPETTAQSIVVEPSGEPETAAANAVVELPDGPDGAADSVDVDLTTLSSTMVYSQVFDMLYQPESYLGKTVRMAGQFASYEVDDDGPVYYACVIQDATACCAQGIEFVPAGGAVSLAEGDEIRVTGVFDLYDEDGETYCTLRDAAVTATS